MDAIVAIRVIAEHLTGRLLEHRGVDAAARSLDRFDVRSPTRRNRGRDGQVLVGPPSWQGRRVATTAELGEGDAYVVGARTELRLADVLGLRWTAVVRQRADIALAPVHTLRRTVFLIVFLAALFSAAAAVMVTRWLTRRLSRLAADAEAVRRGDHRALPPPPGADEVSRIDFSKLQRVARTVLATAWTLANAPTRLRIDAPAQTH